MRPLPLDVDYSSDYSKGTIHRVSVLLEEELTRAIFVEAVELVATDDELAAISAELQLPVMFDTQHFGVLTLDRQISWFKGTINWNGSQIDIQLHVEDNLDITPQLATAEALFVDSLTWSRRVQEFAVQKLLELANRWKEDAEEDPEPICPAEFLRRMQLCSISIYADGEFEFWHDDGDLFWGHSIQISGSLSDGLKYANIPG